MAEEKDAPGDVTQLLQDWKQGDDDAQNQLMRLIYDELRRLAGRYLRSERPDHTLKTTDLVHETYLRLVGQEGAQWQNRAQFFAIAARMMRRVLVNHAHKHLAAKRGHGARKLSLDEAVTLSPERAPELIALDDALKRLAAIDPLQARIVELRFFAGLTKEEMAPVLNISAATIGRKWRMARAWLYRSLTEEEAGPSEDVADPP